MNVPGRSRSDVVLFGLVMACLSVAIKLPIVAYGLPAEFNADEPTILKDPFRLAFLYAHGDFSNSTNLFLWLLQGWYALLFPLGRLLGYWDGLQQFRESIAAESVVVLLWGRLFGVAASACAVFVLSMLVARLVPRWRERLLIVAILAVNPIDLVAAAWLKYDGAAALVNAILIAAFVRYLDSNETRDRRWLYFLAIAAVSFRVDFVAFPIAVILYDAVSRRRWLEVFGPVAAGIAAYGVITLRPLVFAYRAFSAGAANPELNVETPFEGHILIRLLADFTSGALPRTVASAIGFYGWLSVSLGIPFLAASPGNIVRDRRVRWLMVLAAIELGALLLSSAQSTRYWLAPSVCLILAGGLAIAAKPATTRLVLLSSVFVLCASMAVETAVHLVTQPDPRQKAGQYIMARSAPTDVIAIEHYLNPGVHAEIVECPDELIRKATATREARIGTGETFAQLAKRPAPDCRRILEFTEQDRFAGSSFAGRWINTYDVGSLEGMLAPPAFFSSTSSYEGEVDPRRQAFAAWVRRQYRLAATFESSYRDPRLRMLLTTTPYHAQLYVYERRR